MKNMKILLLVFITLSTTLHSFGSDFKIGFGFKTAVQNSVFKHSVLTKPFNYRAAIYDEDRCKRYKRMTIVGAVMIGVGAGVVTGSTFLVITGLDRENRGLDEGPLGMRNVGMIIGGAVLGAIGAAATIGGMAIAIKNGIKIRRYCRKEEGTVYLSPRLNGVGFAYKF